MTTAFQPGISAWIRRYAQRHPSKPAISFRGVDLTYAAMDQRVDELAAWLQRCSVSPGDRVAVLLNNRPDYLSLLFATARIGAVFVPLNVRLAGTELAFVVEHADPKVVITESAFGDVVSQLRSSLGGRLWASLDEQGLPGFSVVPSMGEQDDPPMPVDIGIDDPLAICYTSGTTGDPKGVVLTHANVLYMTFSIAMDVGLTGGHKPLMVLPLCFTGGLFPATMPFFHLGCTMVLGEGFEPGSVLSAIAEHRPTYMSGVPTMFKALLDHEDFSTTPLDSLEVLLSGGAPMPLPILKAYEERGVPFVQGYGLTETGGFNSYLAPHEAASHPGSVGRSVLYAEIRVVDEYGSDVAAGTPGEVLVSGPSVMAEYYRNPAATSRTVVDGWLRTGDLGRLDEDGYLYIVDRLKDMVISGGLNVYPAEVESVLFQLDGIAELAVIGLPDERWGEAVTAVVRLHEGAELSDEDIKSHCAARLADYKRPRRIVRWDAAEMPRTASGKLLKREIRDVLSEA